jgi:hypothetical protein
MRFELVALLNLTLVVDGVRPGCLLQVRDDRQQEYILRLAEELGLAAEVTPENDVKVWRRGELVCADVGKFLGYVCWDHDIFDATTPGWSFNVEAARTGDGERVALWAEVCKKKGQLAHVECHYQRVVNDCQESLVGYRVYCVVEFQANDASSRFWVETHRIHPTSQYSSHEKNCFSTRMARLLTWSSRLPLYTTQSSSNRSHRSHRARTHTFS